MKIKAAVTEGPGKGFKVEEIDMDDPIGAEVLVDVRASGLCHSDQHIQKEGFGFTFPAVLGHEISGEVAAVGPDVTEFKVGDRVSASLIQACGTCPSCRDGRPFQCYHPERTQRGEQSRPRISRNGKSLFQYSALSGFAEKALVHENQLAHIPKEMPFTVGAILGCGVITGAGAALNTATIKARHSVAVIGCGGVGLNTISGARLAGASTIIAIDLQPGKLELARKFGATHTINPKDGDVVEAIRAICPRGVDHAFEVIGLKETCQLAINLIRVGGSAYIMGLQKPGDTIELRPWEDMVIGQKKIHGVQMGSTDFKRDAPLYSSFYLQGRMNLDDLISEEISINDIERAYAELDRGAVARMIITSF